MSPQLTHPPRQYAAEIIKHLTNAADSGHRPDLVFDDWLRIVEATLDMLPAHARAAAKSREMAEDSPECKAVWADVRSRHRPETFTTFARAWGALQQSTQGHGDSVNFCDTIGEVYMQFGNPHPGAGQFFTPFPIAQAMAQMNDVASLVRERTLAALRDSVLGQASMIASMVLVERQEASDQWTLHFITRTLPLIAPHYYPVTVCDPACGSGVMFLATASTLEPWMNMAGMVTYYGVDIDATCCRMARVNLKLYGLNRSLRLAHALSATPEEIEAVPEPHRGLYVRAREAKQAGDSERVKKITAAIRDPKLKQADLW